MQGLENEKGTVSFQHIQKRKLWLRGNKKMHFLPSALQYIASCNDRGRITLMRPLAWEHIFGLEVTHSDMALHQRISVKTDLFFLELNSISRMSCTSENSVTMALH